MLKLLGMYGTQVVVMGDKNRQAVAVRRNELMLGSYRLSVWAQRVFLYLVSEVKDEHTEATPYVLPIAELAKEVGFEDKNLYRGMWGIVRELADTYVQVDSLEEPEKKVLVGLVVNKVKPRIDGDRDRLYTGGSFVVTLHADLLPYVKLLKERFTKVELKYAFRLRSTFSQRLYDIFKTQEFHGREFVVALAELRKMLAMKDTDMARFPDFRRFVLEKACGEINERTDIHVVYSTLKTGNRVDGINFQVKRRKAADVERQVDFIAGSSSDDLYRRLAKAGLSGVEAKGAVQRWGKSDPARIEWHLKEMLRKQTAGEIKTSPLAWLRSGLKKDYRPQMRMSFEEKKLEKQEIEAERRKRVAPNRSPSGAAAVGDILKNVVQEGPLAEALRTMAAGVGTRSKVA